MRTFTISPKLLLEKIFCDNFVSASVPNFIPTPEFPALQYFDSVDKGGSAEKAGLRPGDFILEVGSQLTTNLISFYTHSESIHMSKSRRTLTHEKEPLRIVPFYHLILKGKIKFFTVCCFVFKREIS